MAPIHPGEILALRKNLTDTLILLGFGETTSPSPSSNESRRVARKPMMTGTS